MALGGVLDRLGDLAEVLLEIGAANSPLRLHSILLVLLLQGDASWTLLHADSLLVRQARVLEAVLAHQVVRLRGELEAITLHQEGVCLTGQCPKEVRGCHFCTSPC